MPDAPGLTLCARFRSWAAAGEVARLICNGTVGFGAGVGAAGCSRRAGDSPWAAAQAPAACRCCQRSRSACWLPGWPGDGSKALHVHCTAAPRGDPRGAVYLLHGRQALELGAGEVLLLQRGRLQHQVLLLRSIHLLQVLRCRVGLPVQGLLDHLWGSSETVGRNIPKPTRPQDPECRSASPCIPSLPVHAAFLL